MPYAIINSVARQADVAQLVEQLICNQQVKGSSPAIGSIFLYMKIVLVIESGVLTFG